MIDDLVTVVVTTYKRPIELLKRAIDSVVMQTYSNLEILVVNDYPEDRENSSNIQTLIQLYKDRKFYFLEPKKNSGACAARNLGITNANGLYIAFLDDDDYWLPNKIEVQIKGFCKDNIGVVYTPYYLKSNGRIKKILSFGKSGRVTEELLYQNTMCIFPMIRTSLLKRIGGFDVALTSGQEHDLLLRLSFVCKFQYINVPVAVYEQSEVSISMNIYKKIIGFERFMEKHKGFYTKYPKAYHYQLLRMVNNMNNAGEYRYAFQLWCKALRFDFWSIQNIVQPIKGIIKRQIGRKAFH